MVTTEHMVYCHNLAEVIEFLRGIEGAIFVMVKPIQKRGYEESCNWCITFSKERNKTKEA